MIKPGTQAEIRLSFLGITEVKDLDVEAIAYDAGVQVSYAPLSGCEATLVGLGSKAIATIKRSPSRGRERFSIAHELGHWDMHRGQSFRCRLDDPSENISADRTKEEQADTYSAHLLMPSWLFNPTIQAFGNPGFNKLQEVADHFETSLIATSLRLIDVHKLPVLIACFHGHKRRWFRASNEVPKRWWLRSLLDDDSFAFDLLQTGKTSTAPRKQPAEVWFENADADQYELLEHCIQQSNGDILVVLYLTDSEMLDARFDPNVGVKKFGQHGARFTSKK